jgi:hypothetical protein
MYAKLNNGVIEKYPYTIGELRKENPNTSFPSSIPNSTLAEYGIVTVIVTGAPKVDYTKNVTQQTPVFNAERNRWETSWVVTDATAEEIEDRVASQAATVRIERNLLIAECDWTQLDDTPITNSKKLEWAAYRQALRDIPSQPGFPFDITWPEKP